MKMLWLLFAQLTASGMPIESWPSPPQPTSPYVQLVDYQPDQPVTIQGAPGYQVALELAPDERIETVSLGDSGAWQVAASKRGDRLFLKPIQAGASTNMIVVTDTRSYLFELSSGEGYQPTYIVRFRYPSEEPPPAARVAGNGELFQPTEYRLSGDKGLRPSSIYDDGVHTYVIDAARTQSFVTRQAIFGDKGLRPSSIYDDGVHTYVGWPADAALPAVYAIGDGGQEMLVNGAMRGGELVIDSVQQKLVFRIDRRSASASRKSGSR